MPVTIENLINQLVLVQCNSGTMLHLAPRKISGDIMEVEVANNPKVQKLLDRHIIAIHKAEKAGHPAVESLETKKEKAGAAEKEKTESHRHKK